MSTQMHSPQAITQTYLDVECLLNETARSFARRYCCRLEEVRAQLDYEFLLAYHKFDRKRGAFLPWLKMRLWFQLQDWVRRQAQKHRMDPVAGAGPLGDFDPTCKEQVNWKKVLLEVSEDAAQVLALILDAPKELVLGVKGLQKQGHPLEEAWLLGLESYLVGLGWYEGTIHQAFCEVENLLGDGV